MDDFSFNMVMGLNMGRRKMKCTMLNLEPSITHEFALLSPGGERLGGGRNNPSGYRQKPFYEWEANATYYFGGSGFSGRIGPGSGNYWSESYNMSEPGSYTYDWSTGNYYYRSGNQVSFNEVYVNYVLPNSTTYCTPTSYNNQSNHSENFNNPLQRLEGNNQDKQTSELLCIIYHKSFKEYYFDFLNQNIAYLGIESLNTIASWIFEVSELYPDEQYLNEYSELNGTTAVINYLVIDSPFDNILYEFGNPFIFEGDKIKELCEIYPYFSYRVYSTLIPSLQYDNIPLIINGNQYNFFMQWRLNQYYTYKP